MPNFFCGIFTRLTLLESSNITNLLQVFVCRNRFIDPNDSLSNELSKDLRRTMLVAFDTVTTKAIGENNLILFP